MSSTRTNISNTNQDPSSVYYIHPSDASTNQLVSVKFNGTGYHTWKRSMVITLSTKNKLGFVNGTIPVPDPTSVEYQYWERCNNLVISWILFNLDEEIASSVLFSDSAKEIWDDLEARFGCTSMTQTYSLEQKLLELKQGTDSVSTFFTKMKAVWNGLNDADPIVRCTCNNCTCNVNLKIQQKEQARRLLQFMMRLNECFSVVRGNIMMMNPLPTIQQAYRLFAQEENHKQLSNLTSQTESLAFAADKKTVSNPSTNSKSFSKPGQFKKGGKPTYYCNHCKVSGHSMERCFKLHGYPPGFQPRKVAAMSEHQNSAQDTDAVPTFSQDQYNHLMNLIEHTSPDHSDVASTSDSSKHALLAGTTI